MPWHFSNNLQFNLSTYFKTFWKRDKNYKIQPFDHVILLAIHDSMHNSNCVVDDVKNSEHMNNSKLQSCGCSLHLGFTAFPKYGILLMEQKARLSSINILRTDSFSAYLILSISVPRYMNTQFKVWKFWVSMHFTIKEWNPFVRDTVI